MSGWRSTICIFVGALLLICQSMSVSMFAPIFPLAARERDVTPATIGSITGTFDISCLISLGILTYMGVVRIRLLFFLSNILLCCGLVFIGSSDYVEKSNIYITMNFLGRASMGIGASMLWTIALPIEGKNTGKAAASLASLLGAGVILGPPFASLGLSIKGFPFPFFVIASLIGVLGLILGILLTSIKSTFSTVNDSPSTSKSFANFFCNMRHLVILLPLICCCAAFGILDTMLAPHLHKVFSFNGNKTGYVFITFAASFCSSVMFCGFLTDRGYGEIIYVTIPCLAGAGFFVQFLSSFHSESLLQLITGLILIGLGLGGAIAPIYSLVERIATREDLPSANIAASGAVCMALSIGKIIGPSVLGGVFYMEWGYFNVMLIEALLIFVSVSIAIAVLVDDGLFDETPAKGEAQVLLAPSNM